jgi:hypothetical protein
MTQIAQKFGYKSNQREMQLKLHVIHVSKLENWSQDFLEIAKISQHFPFGHGQMWDFRLWGFLLIWVRPEVGLEMIATTLFHQIQLRNVEKM